MNTHSFRLAILLPLVAMVTVIVAISDNVAQPQKAALQKGSVPKSSQSKKSPRSYGILKREKWTTSRITGSPEPPPPYRTQRVFTKLSFKQPTLISSAPGTDRLFVAEQAGKIFSFPNDPACEAADLFIDLKAEFKNLTENSNATGIGSVYGLAFHPQFETNRYCYVCYTLTRNKNAPAGQLSDGTRVVRFQVSDTNPPRCDPNSEKVIIDWLGGGHNGGCLKFGPEGYLYISSGDGGNAFPPDGLNSGQDTGNLLSSIMRIDVDQTDDGLAYAIPKDNPFVDVEGSRGEIWAYGLRNPWKMSFDRETGDLWVGDVGWELWELVYQIERGGNYGWSIMEGPQPVHMERKRGPTPILPPTVEIPHTDGASVTGGFVYRGKKFKDLVGTYIFGDWETRRVWGIRFENGKATPKLDLVEPEIRLVAFAEDNAGELYLLDYDNGTIHQFFKNETSAEASKDFPRKLSETGLFRSTANHQPAPGVVPFSVNVEQWSDHSTAERFVALPGDSSITLHDKPAKVAGSMFSRMLDFPADGVLAKTISLEMERGNPKSRRRLETQILHFNGKTWRGYSYQWNDEQTDATLLDSTGGEQTFSIVDPDAPGGKRKQTWTFPARVQCTRCHNPWAENTLAFNIKQLDKNHDYDGIVDSQFRTLKHIGILAAEKPIDKTKSKPATPSSKFTNPYDETADLDARARSYLHVNCAHCHRFNGGGVSYILLEFDKTLEEMKLIGSRPTQGTFGIHDASIVSVGDPFQSVMYYRLATAGRGRMPHIGSKIVDEKGLQLIYNWIKQMPARANEDTLITKLRDLDEAVILAREEELKQATVNRIARQLAKSAKRTTITDADTARAKKQATQQATKRAKTRVKNRTTAITKLLSSTTGALQLARELKTHHLSNDIRNRVLELLTKQASPPVRELFDQFLPDDKRSKRLGSVIQPEKILKLAGDITRGKQLFFNTEGVQCKNCHKINKVGKEVGPDLSHVGKKNNRSQLLESILQPSKKIEPKFATYLVETEAGKVITGLLIEKTKDMVILRDAQNKESRIPADQIEQLVPQRRSIMPELLVRDLTAQQVADLLAYLSSLK